MRVSLDDGAVYAGGESEVVRVYDEAPQGASVAGVKGLVVNRGSRCLDISVWWGLTDFSAVTYTREGAVRADAPLRILTRRGNLVAREYEGRLAQLVRAPALQAGGRRFESCTAHHL